MQTRLAEFIRDTSDGREADGSRTADPRVASQTILAPPGERPIRRHRVVTLARRADARARTEELAAAGGAAQAEADALVKRARSAARAKIVAQPDVQFRVLRRLVHLLAGRAVAMPSRRRVHASGPVRVSEDERAQHLRVRGRQRAEAEDRRETQNSAQHCVSSHTLEDVRRVARLLVVLSASVLFGDRARGALDDPRPARHAAIWLARRRRRGRSVALPARPEAHRDGAGPALAVRAVEHRRVVESRRAVVAKTWSSS